MTYDLIELVMLIIIFLGILALSYFVTKKMAMVNKRMNFNKNMEIIEVMQLMQGQYLMIVKIGKEYHLVGCSQKGSISYCQKLDDTALNLERNPHQPFETHLKEFMKGKLVKKHEE